MELVNTNAVTKRLTLPLGYNTLGEIELTNNEAWVFGSFVQPRGLTNVGFRNVSPRVEADISFSGTNALVSFSAPGRASYQLEYCDDGSFTNWTRGSSMTATGEVARLTNSVPPGVSCRLYRVVLRKP